MAKPELWTCPKCGNRFVTANMWHSCGAFTLDDLFAKANPNVRTAYDAFEAMARGLAEITVIPQKSRVTFQTRTRFAGGSPKKEFFDATFVFFRSAPHPRVHKIEDFLGKWFVHHVKLAEPEDVDGEIEAWLKEALEYGNQARKAEKSK